MTQPPPLDYMFPQNNRPVWSHRAIKAPFIALAFLPRVDVTEDRVPLDPHLINSRP